MTSSTERLLNGTINGVEGEHTCGHCGSAQVAVADMRDLNTGRVEPATAYFCRVCKWTYALRDPRMNGELIPKREELYPVGVQAALNELAAHNQHQVDAYAQRVRAFREEMNGYVVVNL